LQLNCDVYCNFGAQSETQVLKQLKPILYIVCSHVNRTTQFENPATTNRRGDGKYFAMNDSRPEPPSMLSAAALAKKQEAEAANRYCSHYA
jgi:hypothetical protein